MAETSPLGVRWTIGDVSAEGYEALRLSIWGARRLFGPEAAYVVCVNSVPVEQARAWASPLPDEVRWLDATALLPPLLRRRFDAGMAEGVGWKLAPLRCFPDRFELSLDNDCILWEVPRALDDWRSSSLPTQRCLVAEDVRACFGRFADRCGGAPRNLGIRGLPPGFDLEEALEHVLASAPGLLTSELDEQGLQLSALSRAEPPRAVSVADVSICSPFPPHVPWLGRCGAHFCGLNAKQLPWQLEGRPASEIVREHWVHHRGTVHTRVGIPLRARPSEDRAAAGRDR